MEVSKHVFGHKDSRGEIFDILQNVEISAVTLVSFVKNSVRGNHFHKKTTQWNYVHSGEIEFVVKINDLITRGVLKQGDLLRIDPNEVHAMKAGEDSIIYVFTLGPRGGKEYESDTYRIETGLLL